MCLCVNDWQVESLEDALKDAKGITERPILEGH